MTKPRIAIVGAGPAGLCLARILSISSTAFDITVFERDDSPNARSQGGTLDLHAETGQAALKRAGLYEEFQKHARIEGEDMIMMDRFGKRWLDLRRGDGSRPEIDRVTLRQILLDSLSEGCVRWGCQLLKAEVDVTGKGKLTFQHGVEENFDLLVGADGAWSKIRPLLTPVKPFYSGISGATLRLSEVDKRNPQIAERVGRGTLCAFGGEEGRAIICQRNSDGSLKVYALGIKPETWVKDNGFDNMSPAQQRSAVLHDYSSTGWSSELLQLIEASDDEIEVRALYNLPVGLRWSSRKGATVIGDAASLMTPFAGEGVNVALTHAFHLAEALIENAGDVGIAIKEYEKWMFPFSREATAETWDSLMDWFQEDGGRKVAEDIKGKLESAGMGLTEEEAPSH